MVTSILFILAILFFVFFIIYKRDMLAKMFSLHASVPAGELQHELEKTADAVIRKLEAQIAHLELLLDEADIKIEELDRKLQLADTLTAKQQSAAIAISPVATIDFSLPPEKPAIPDDTVIAEKAALPEKTAVFEKTPSLENRSLVEPFNTLPKENKDGLNNDKRRTIIMMSDQGYSVTEIAKQTGLGKGEIILFLQLNRK